MFGLCQDMRQVNRTRCGFDSGLAARHQLGFFDASSETSAVSLPDEKEVSSLFIKANLGITRPVTPKPLPTAFGRA